MLKLNYFIAGAMFAICIIQWVSHQPYALPFLALLLNVAVIVIKSHNRRESWKVMRRGTKPTPYVKSVTMEAVE